MSRICREVEATLPELVAGTLGAGRRRLVLAHLRRCAACRAEHERQQAVAAGLERLGEDARSAPEAPPDGLLDALLEQARQPGVRGRAAVPARGAVSGARPALSLLLLVVGAASGTAVGYAGWRASRALRAGRRGRARR